MTLSSQFDFYRLPDEGFKAGEGRGYGPTQFVAADYDDDPVGTVKYYPPRELPMITRARYGSPEDDGQFGQQGEMFKQHPATVDMLAVSPQEHGQGIGSSLVELAVGEHQARFGQNSVPKVAEQLSADSSAMATKLTGRLHSQTWGTGVSLEQETDDWGDPVKAENNWAQARLADEHHVPEAMREEADWHEKYGEADDQPIRPIRQYPTGDLSHHIAQYTGSVPPEAPGNAPDQSTWGPKGTGDKQLSMLSGKGSRTPQIKKRLQQ